MMLVKMLSLEKHDIELLEHKIELLNRRAARLGCEPITLDIGEPTDLYECRRGAGTVWLEEPDEHATGAICTVYDVKVIGEPPKLNGWWLLAVMEPVATDDGVENLVRAVPGCEVPQEYYTKVGVCDHCGTTRRRSKTYVVSNGSETKIVGKSCLKDFLGHANPADYVRFMVDVAGIEEVLTPHDRTPSEWDLKEFIKVVCAIVAAEGWMSRSAARAKMAVSTADTTINYLLPPKSPSRDYLEWRRNISAAVGAMGDRADEIIEWAKSLEPTSEYEHNINLIARSGRVKFDQIGMAASMVGVYNKREADQRTESHHVGEVGKRMELTVTCNSVRKIDGYYGVCGLHQMADEHGNDLVWFANGTRWLAPGRTYQVKATVKKHDVRNGRKQTVLTRVSVIE